nr:MAG TPA: hypothetical protein [Caudoviricetes sp.]
MKIETVTESDAASVFKLEDGRVYVVAPMSGTEDPETLVNNYNAFIFGDSFVRENLGPEPFNLVVNYMNHHNSAPTTEELPELFRGELCRSFRCDNWEDYDTCIDHYIVYCVSKKLGTAKQWMDYQEMWENGDVWQIIDTSKNIVVTNVYASTAHKALNTYLDKGLLASLQEFVNNALGRN